MLASRLCNWLSAHLENTLFSILAAFERLELLVFKIRSCFGYEKAGEKMDGFYFHGRSQSFDLNLKASFQIIFVLWR